MENTVNDNAPPTIRRRQPHDEQSLPLVHPPSSQPPRARVYMCMGPHGTCGLRHATLADAAQCLHRYHARAGTSLFDPRQVRYADDGQTLTEADAALFDQLYQNFAAAAAPAPASPNPEPPPWLLALLREAKRAEAELLRVGSAHRARKLSQILDLVPEEIVVDAIVHESI